MLQRIALNVGVLRAARAANASGTYACWLAVVAAVLNGCAAPIFDPELRPYDVIANTAPSVEVRPVAIPPPPKLESAESEKPAKAITLAHAILTALERNSQVRVVGYDQRIAARQVVMEDAAFDATLSAGGNWSNSRNQSATQIGSLGDDDGTTEVTQFGVPPAQSDTLSLSKRMRQGGFASLGLGVTFDETDSDGNLVLINPAWRTNINVSIEQPLGRGFGRDINELGISIARSSHEQSVHQFRTIVAELVRDVHLSYWDLTSAQMSVAESRDAVTEGIETRKSLEQKFELGSASLPDLAQAVQFAEQRQAELAKAESRREVSEQQLRALMGIAPDDGKRLVTADRPFDDQYIPKWEEGVRLAFENRPELAALAERVRGSRLGLTAARDSLKPDVTAYVSGATAGLDDNFEGATDTALDNDFGSWAFGLRYSRQLGRRADRVNHEMAALAVGQSRAELRRTEESILSELRSGYQDLIRGYQGIQHERIRVQAAAVFKDARKEMYDLGMLTIDDYLTAQFQLADAKLALQLRLVEYNVAIARWKFATGTILADDETLAGSVKPATPAWTPALEMLKNPPPSPSLPEFETPPVDGAMTPEGDEWKKYLPPIDEDLFGLDESRLIETETPLELSTVPVDPESVDAETQRREMMEPSLIEPGRVVRPPVDVTLPDDSGWQKRQ